MTAANILAAWVATHFTGLGARLFRNNVGEAWLGPTSRTREGGVYIAKPRRVVYGLCVGSSDHVGWTPVTITAEDVGRTLAIFTAVEEKTLHDRLSEPQRNFLDQVHRAGGLAYVARETKDGPLLNRWPEETSPRKKRG
jgi:hypothetical protein